MTSKEDRKNAKIDEKILREVHAMRSQYHAATLRNVASHMHISETAVRNRMNRMRGEFLDWNPVPGSVHLLPAGMTRIGLEVEFTVIGSAGDAPPAAPPAPSVEDQVAAAVAAGVQAALAALTASTTTSPAPVAEEGHAAPTSPGGSQPGTPDTDQDRAPASPEVA